MNPAMLILGVPCLAVGYFLKYFFLAITYILMAVVYAVICACQMLMRWDRGKDAQSFESKTEMSNAASNAKVNLDSHNLQGGKPPQEEKPFQMSDAASNAKVNLDSHNLQGGKPLQGEKPFQMSNVASNAKVNLESHNLQGGKPPQEGDASSKKKHIKRYSLHGRKSPYYRQPKAAEENHKAQRQIKNEIILEKQAGLPKPNESQHDDNIKKSSLT